MKKFGLIIFTSFLGLSLASCGSSSNNTGSNTQKDDDSYGDVSSGGNDNTGHETTSFQQIVENFETTIKNGFSIKASGSFSVTDSSYTYSFGVNSDGFWYIQTFNGSYSGSVYKKNGEGYLYYDVDNYGEVINEPEEVTKDEANNEYATNLGMFEGRLFAYYDFLADASITDNGFYIGRECTSYKHEIVSGISTTFTVDDTLKINLKYKQVTTLDGANYEDTFTVSEVKTGNEVNLPLN